MKLRDFVANSLPRVRGKKKKQNQIQRTLNNERYDANKNKNKVPDANASWECCHDNNNKCPPEGSCEYALNQAVKSVCGEIIDTFNIDTYNYRVNNSLGEDQYTCYNDLSSYQKTEEADKKNEAANISSDSEKQFNTVPKTRSRIRTNPWLPSPRSTPSNSSGSSSPTSSVTTSPLSPIHHKLRSLCIKDSCTLSTTSSDSFMDTDQSASSPDSAVGDVTEASGVLDRDKWSGRLDLSHLPSFKEDGAYSYTAWDTDASTDLSPCTENCNCNENIGEPEHNISFEYEEALDDTLEKGSVKRDISLQDLLDDDVQKDVAVQTEFEDYDEDSDWLIDGSSDEGSTDLASGECVKYCCVRDIMQDSTDTGYSSLGRDGQTELDDEFQFIKPDQYQQTEPCQASEPDQGKITPILTSISEIECVCEALPATEEPPVEDDNDIEKERYVTNRYPEETSGRTLQEIKTSLEEKVFLLRQEKRIVEQKIKEAQEEEKIRQQEKMRFHRQLNIHRKQILLKTLHDLKAKLECQSERLQDSYSAVLTMQKRFAQRNSPLLLLASSST